ncbi:hypothetical protein JCM10908_002241 [Rhodotorula pacifica]|uniref:uncharacterized protein n=1 Tax=Rhodotorula pacifica TaxID=1495444 RepID=UPI00317DD541
MAEGQRTIADACSRRFNLLCAALLTFAAAGIGAAASSAGEKLVLRGSKCNGAAVRIWRSGSEFVCRGVTANAGGTPIRSIDSGTISTVASQVTDWITSHAHYGDTSAGRRLARRAGADGAAGNQTLSVQVGNVQVNAVPFVEADGRLTVDIGAFLQAKQDAGTVIQRYAAASGALYGGSVSFHPDGSLDTFTLHFSVPSSSSATTDATTDLAKPSANTLHTTYWAVAGHDATDLSWDKVDSLATVSYKDQDATISQVCGYMANSGSWHGAYRHWTGDNGYIVGECLDEREF